MTNYGLVQNFSLSEMRWISHLIIWDRIANFQWSSLHSAGLWTTWDVGFAHPWESFCTWNEGSNSFNGPVIFIFKLGHYWKNHVWRRRPYADTSVKKNCEHWSSVNSLRTLIGWNRFFNILSQNVFYFFSNSLYIKSDTRKARISRVKVTTNTIQVRTIAIFVESGTGDSSIFAVGY